MNNRDKHELVYLEWWFGIGRETTTKDELLSSRTEWEEVHQVLFNATGDHLTHDQVKYIIRKADKDGLTSKRVKTLKEALEHKQIKKLNITMFGFPGGIDELMKKLEMVRHKDGRRSKTSEHYRDYIRSPEWKARSRRYLDENACYKGEWICEMCGTSHEVVEVGRTIQVHHSSYDSLCKELDCHLMACCEYPCHVFADVARRFSAGSLESSDINDLCRPLFHV